MYPSSLVADYVEFIVELAQKGHFETYYCEKCIDLLEFSKEHQPGNPALVDTAFCSECHRCSPVSNPYINQYITRLGNLLAEPADSSERQRSDFRLIHYDLHGRGYQTDGWLRARVNKITYERAFQQNLQKVLTPYWRQAGYGTQNFNPGELERRNTEADFIESTMKRIYGTSLLPISPAPDFLSDHPINEEVKNFAQFLIELASKRSWEDFYCERCQLDHLSIEPPYVPFTERYSDFGFLENTGNCIHCNRCNDVSNPDINRYFIDRNEPFKYPLRYEVNSNAFMIRDVLINWSLRRRCSKLAEAAEMPYHKGLTADEIYSFEYQSEMNLWFQNDKPSLLTPPHEQLLRNTYLAILGPELKPISTRLILTNPDDPVPTQQTPPVHTVAVSSAFSFLTKFLKRFSL